MICPCIRKSAVYENVCAEYNEGAWGKGELKNVNPDIPSIYVGKTSRSIKERAGEHWKAALGSKQAQEGSHMVIHPELYYNGREPNFVMRIVQLQEFPIKADRGGGQDNDEVYQVLGPTLPQLV